MRVFCYYNLHKHCFSVKALEGPDKGRVVAHARAVHLSDVTFKVSQAGRNRVLRERRKNVHAGAVGQLTDYLALTEAPTAERWQAKTEGFGQGTAVSYNPYKTDTFFEVVSDKPIQSAAQCLLNGKQAIALH